MNSKQKGNRGEREFAALCREHGHEDAARNIQFGHGCADNPDVRGLPGIHVEVKRVEKLNIHDAMRQSRLDAGGKRMPIVAHRKNRDEWMITMRAVDWFELYGSWKAAL